MRERAEQPPLGNGTAWNCCGATAGFFLSGSLLFLGVCLVLGRRGGGAVSCALCVPCAGSGALTASAGTRGRCSGWCSDLSTPASSRGSSCLGLEAAGLVWEGSGPCGALWGSVGVSVGDRSLVWDPGSWCCTPTSEPFPGGCCRDRHPLGPGLSPPLQQPGFPPAAGCDPGAFLSSPGGFSEEKGWIWSRVPAGWERPRALSTNTHGEAGLAWRSSLSKNEVQAEAPLPPEPAGEGDGSRGGAQEQGRGAGRLRASPALGSPVPLPFRGNPASCFWTGNVRAARSFGKQSRDGVFLLQRFLGSWEAFKWRRW